ncbi:DeoR/GlpR family DNA-binding transcription regulator [Amorphus orientalis]|uniref:DeoR family glycerol-3-phosphate regulon repressor n=1 Tax=Amorphus orientalis TaxID=649198 RepID=A0AAE3VRK3_9HYPH|nr:DeoR/GlpR family DNA-binding transcription regulator [Amorphus orientalis]MDQ0317469.1 DeoR family glycerol-3-phosphate regulon repressor [Amorphus orientalis]
MGERREQILSDLQEAGFVTIDGLAQRFGCSAQTVRRDLIAMEQLGLLKRFHGGAGLSENETRPSYSAKQAINPAGKEAIGQAAAGLIRQGDTVLFDVGTTVEAAARALRTRLDAGELMDLRGVCVALNAAMILAGAPGIAVEVLPGEVKTPDGAITGAPAIAALRDVRLDHAFLGVSAFDADGAAWDFDPAKVAIKRAALEAAKDGWALADAGKFARTARRRVCAARQLRGVITDRDPPADLAEAFAAAECSVLIA